MNFLKRHARIIVIIAVACSSMSAVFTRFAGDISPLALAFYRLSFSLPFFIFLGTAKSESRAELLAMGKKNLLLAALAGILLAAHFVSWFTAVNLTTIASASVLCGMHPVVIVILCAVFLKERPTTGMLISVIAALIGAVILTGGDYYSSAGGSNAVGDILAFSAAVFVALYWVLGRKVRQTVSAAPYVLVLFSACWLTLLAAMIITKTPFTGYSPQTMLWAFAMAICCQIMGHMVFNWSLGYVSPLFISVSDNCSAVFSAFLGALLFGEFPTIFQVFGAFIVITALICYCVFEHKRDISAKNTN